MTGGIWSTMPHSDKINPTSSVGSINMASDDSSSDSSDDEIMDREIEDSLLTTPQASKLSSNFISGAVNSPGGEWLAHHFHLLRPV